MVRATDRVPFWFWKAVGSTRTCTTAGVIPEEGEMVTPWVLVESWKSVLPPPGSVMVMVWVITLRLQKVPRATTSRTEADEAVLLVQSADGEDHDAAIGDGVQHVGGGAQHAAAGDVFGNREALPDQQVLGIHDGQHRRRGGAAGRGAREDDGVEAAVRI